MAKKLNFSSTMRKVWGWGVLSLFALLMAGCAALSPGEKFVGTWVFEDKDLGEWHLTVSRPEGASGTSGDNRFVVLSYMQEEGLNEADQGTGVLEGNVLKVFYEGELAGEMSIDASGLRAVYQQQWYGGKALVLVRLNAAQGNR